MSSTLMILVSVTTMAILSGETFAALPAQCNSGFLEELPPRLRKICVAIARIWDAREMNDFVDNRGDQTNYQLNNLFFIYIIFIFIFLRTFGGANNSLKNRK